MNRFMRNWVRNEMIVFSVDNLNIMNNSDLILSIV